MTPRVYVCDRCGEQIDGNPHTDPETGGDVHEQCCAECWPDLAEAWGIEA
ncbi:MAG: hypothetical protein KTQ12_09185 [Dermatophilaceae bacterium]|nr:hypothetical protein [Dermatophilaceae bacterium]